LKILFLHTDISDNDSMNDTFAFARILYAIIPFWFCREKNDGKTATKSGSNVFLMSCLGRKKSKFLDRNDRLVGQSEKCSDVQMQ
jgi:hypothetical protein